MKKMVCDKNHQARSFSHETKKSILCMLIFLFRLYYLSIDACHNINCNYEQCLINQHDGTPYCECLPGYEGVRCVDEMRMIDSCE